MQNRDHVLMHIVPFGRNMFISFPRLVQTPQIGEDARPQGGNSTTTTLRQNLILRLIFYALCEIVNTRLSSLVAVADSCYLKIINFTASKRGYAEFGLQCIIITCSVSIKEAKWSWVYTIWREKTHHSPH